MANLSTFFWMAYGDNSILVIFDLGKSLAVTINKKRGLLTEQDGTLITVSKEVQGCQKKEIRN